MDGERENRQIVAQVGPLVRPNVHTMWRGTRHGNPYSTHVAGGRMDGEEMELMGTDGGKRLMEEEGDGRRT